MLVICSSCPCVVQEFAKFLKADTTIDSDTHLRGGKDRYTVALFTSFAHRMQGHGCSYPPAPCLWDGSNTIDTCYTCMKKQRGNSDRLAMQPADIVMPGHTPTKSHVGIGIIVDLRAPCRCAETFHLDGAQYLQRLQVLDLCDCKLLVYRDVLVRCQEVNCHACSLTLVDKAV